MKEELLHFIWQSKLLLGKPLFTLTGDPIQIIQLGTYNTNAGPDFFNAKLKIGDTLWAGNVEMHISSSEWDQHKHQLDDSYNNVILHVVYVDDKKVTNAIGEFLPTLELRSIIPASLLKRYHSLQQQNTKHLACEKILIKPSEIILNSWLQRLLVERLEQKCDNIKELLSKSHHHYEHCFYVLTARYFGMKTNAQPFEQLASTLPISVIAKHKNNLEDIITLVLGAAGLLPVMGDKYAHLLPAFEHFKQKYRLAVLDASVWKFSRTRPGNFPTIRLLQFASLLYQSSHLLSSVLKCNNIQELQKLYQVKQPYHTDTISLSIGAINLLLINSVLPFVFLYGKLNHKEELCEKAISWYEQLPAENNSITKQFTAFNLPLNNAADSQAYIQLKNQYCIPLKCLHCSIGFHSLLHA